MAQQLRRSSRVSRPPQRFEDQPFLVGYDKEGRAVYETHNDVAAHLFTEKMCPAKRKRITAALARDVEKGSVPSSLLRDPAVLPPVCSGVGCDDGECACSSVQGLVCDAVHCDGECAEDEEDGEECEEPDDDDATDESFITDSDGATPSDDGDDSAEEDEFVSDDDTESTECVVLSDDDERDDENATTDEEEDLSESDGGPDAGDCLHPAGDSPKAEDAAEEQPHEDADAAADGLHPALDVDSPALPALHALPAAAADALVSPLLTPSSA